MVALGDSSIGSCWAISWDRLLLAPKKERQSVRYIIVSMKFVKNIYYHHIIYSESSEKKIFDAIFLIIFYRRTTHLNFI